MHPNVVAENVLMMDSFDWGMLDSFVCHSLASCIVQTCRAELQTSQRQGSKNADNKMEHIEAGEGNWRVMQANLRMPEPLSRS